MTRSTVPRERQMSDTTHGRKDVSTDAPSKDYDGLAAIVAQTVPVGNDLPDFEEFRAICGFTHETIERTIAEEI